MHPFILQWLIARLLWLKLEPAFLRAIQRDDYGPLLRAVNRTDCYPCLVRIDGWHLSIFARFEAPALPLLADDE